MSIIVDNRYRSPEQQKSIRRIIIITAVMALIVVALIATIVIVANHKNTSTTAVETETVDSNFESVSEPVAVNNESSQTTESPKTTTPKNNTTATASETPDTGPADLALTALLAGVSVFLLTNLLMKKSNQIA